MEPTNKSLFLSAGKMDCAKKKKNSSFCKMTSQHSATLSFHFLPIMP